MSESGGAPEGAPRDGLDETKLTLTEHLSELRGRLIKALIAVAVTTSATLFFAAELLDYATEPLRQVMRQRNRVETVVAAPAVPYRDQLVAQLAAVPKVRPVAVTADGAEVVAQAVAAEADKQPVDLMLVDVDLWTHSASLADGLDTLDPPPSLVVLVPGADHPALEELRLEGAEFILQRPSLRALRRAVRRAAASAGKSASGDKLVLLSPLDLFFAYLKIAFVCGLFLACPVWLYQAWQFIAPGLYRQERQVVLPSITAASGLFVGGGLFAYYLMFPVMFDVLINEMMPSTLAGTFTVDKYLGFLLRVTVAFGVVFELPLVISMLSRVGLVTDYSLVRFRKYAVILAFVLGAFLTPADPVSQVMMALPLVLFYEIGVYLARRDRKRRERRFERDMEHPPSARG